MAQRGRKSAASLTVAPPSTLGRLPEPPAVLTDYEAAVWVSVTSTKPSDWFQADSFQLLISYCKHCSSAAILDKELAEFEPKWLRTDEGIDRYRKLVDMRDKQTRAISSLSRSMRLSQQTRYDPQKANRRDRGPQAKGRPWDS